MNGQRGISIPAHAKVNLALAVGPPLPPEAGPRAGFHPVCSWMHAIDLRDTLSLTRRDAGTSTHALAWAPDAPRPSPIDWPLDKDLCVRAQRALEAHVGHPLPVAMTLSKRIPVGGGLGGGSADAAAMLLGLSTLFDLGLDRPALRALGAALGSDVAFFLGGQTHDTGPAGAPPPALVSGLGDRIEPVARTTGWLALIFPPVGCPTGPVYRAFDAALAPGHTLRDHAVRDLAAHTAATAAIPSDRLFNDLAEPAFAVAPGLRALRDTAAATLGRPVHVTGSGSTLFALCPSRAAAEAACTTLRSVCPDAAAVPARLV